MTDKNIDRIRTLIPHIPLSIISQGAEAIVFDSCVHPYYNTLFDKSRCVVKYRPSKPYRHPKIDASITKTRTIGEIKFMAKLMKLGIPAPALILADIGNGIIWMEFRGSFLSNGQVSSLKNWLWQLEKSLLPEKCVDLKVETCCFNVGKVIGQLHLNDMIHGDLTLSNILLENLEPILIDFGLSSYSSLAEDKAVDMYVLERALLSTHSMFADKYTMWVMDGYKNAHYSSSQKHGPKVWKDTLNKLQDVRLRGRKQNMVG